MGSIAKFVKSDPLTQGSWPGVYGIDGQDIIGGNIGIPSYAIVGQGPISTYVWDSSTPDVRALESAGGRVAACWYTGNEMDFSLTFKDANAHLVAIYCLDWDGYNGGRNQTVSILDASGNVLDSRVLTSFQGGLWLSWIVTGSVTVRVTNNNAASNAAISGILFGPTTSSVVVVPSNTSGRLFPANNIWNAPVESLPVLVGSDGIISAMAATSLPLRCDDIYSLNICQNPPLVSVSGIQTPQSDANPYGIPPSPLVETASDHHCLIIDAASNMLYEFWNFIDSEGSYSAGSAAKWDLNSNGMRAIDSSQGETTSADAAGLPMSPGVVQYADILAGSVTHCLRMTSTPTLDHVCTWPATHWAGRNSTIGPMMGQRLRLKANFDLTPFIGQALIILQGLKVYGAMIADNGLSFATQHDQDPRWDATDLLQLHKVPGTAMEVVDVSALMINPTFMQAGLSDAPSLLMVDRLGRATPVGIGSGLTVVGGKIGLA